jgi:hypothetical protein
MGNIVECSINECVARLEKEKKYKCYPLFQSKTPPKIIQPPPEKITKVKGKYNPSFLAPPSPPHHKHTQKIKTWS